jgi:hypothetical protein
MNVLCTKLAISTLETRRSKLQENTAGTALLLHAEADFTKWAVSMLLLFAENQV